MSADPDPPVPVVVVGGADDPSPFLTIRTVCSRCHRTVASREIDVPRRLAERGGPGSPAPLGAIDARAWSAHVERGCRRRG